ncbi:FkbM family methyltransferase [uncultured Alsobacter sp.]|uniref:FkbM family methyltransferase n=1 Tax=uncultured Alsobacter sp. TaxID=1748258 RepID=UPI0025F822EF|nr:FkbM family methyltransferase [uncultured Alsobacter sp.]
MPTVDATRVNLRGRDFRVADDKPTFWARACAGTWEPETLAALEEVVRPGDTVLDIGAWVGPTVLFSAALGARVVAVEADPAAQDQLARNLAVNPALAERISVIRAAATPDGASVRLGAARKRGDSMSSALLTGAADTWECPGIAPAALLEAAAVAPGAALVVKIDIEGGEYALVPALAPLLPPWTRAVLLAVHPRILDTSGAGPDAVRTATAKVLSAFQGWSVRVLDPGPDAAITPAEAAARDNLTLQLARPMLA